MDVKKVVSQGKALNIALIVVTICAFLIFNVTNSIATEANFQTLVTVQTAVLWVYRLASLICLVLAVLLFAKGKSIAGGLGLLLASAIISMIFAVLGLMLGIVIWILSAISMKKLSQTVAENDFNSKLEGM